VIVTSVTVEGKQELEWKWLRTKDEVYQAVFTDVSAVKAADVLLGIGT